MTFQPDPGTGQPAFQPNPYPAGDPFAAAGTAPYQDAPGVPPYPGMANGVPPYPVPNDPYANFTPPPPYPGPYGGYPPSRSTNGLAIASLITSLVGAGLGPFTCGTTVAGCVVGPILGFAALNQIKESGDEGRGMALAGIIIGLGVLVLTLALVIVIFVAAGSMATLLG